MRNEIIRAVTHDETVGSLVTFIQKRMKVPKVPTNANHKNLKEMRKRP